MKADICKMWLKIFVAFFVSFAIDFVVFGDHLVFKVFQRMETARKIWLKN
jgi:hypothetical protein